LDHPLLAGGEIGEFIDVVLLTSMHSDHLGTQKINVGAPGPCSANALITIAPDTNTTDIAFAKDAQIFVGGEMRDFLRTKMGGKSALVDVLRPGGERKPTGSEVRIAVVQAIHSNGIPRNALTDATLPGNLATDGLTAYAGPDHGYIIQFTNGLVVYLTGDTGQTSDMLHIAGKDGYYGANLAVVNMGGVFSMGPKEAAWAVDHLIKPKSVILTHSNENSTDGTASNTVRDGSKMDTFMTESNTQAHIPSTGRTMEFNGLGRCVAGACQPNN
jgi:L-ascorbate metabolism protein UlaG (beta-lactamase superfamily)